MNASRSLSRCPFGRRPSGSPTLLLATLLALIPAATLTAAPDDAADAPAPPQATVREEIVVSANRLELPARRVGSSVTVLDRDEIEARHESTLLEVLRTVPGIAVVQAGGPGKAASVFVRGGNSSHTLVLIDGVRVNSNSSGEYDFSDLVTDDVERIEVLRGPQGTLYGSEAVAGVISVTTRRGEGPTRFRGEAEVGSDGYNRVFAGVSGGDERLDYRLSVSRTETDGVSAASEDAGNTEDDPWENTTLSGRFGVGWGSDGRADLTLRYAQGDTDLDGFTFGVGPTDDLNAVQERKALQTGLTVTQPLASWWKQTVFVGASRDELTGSDPDTFFNNFEIGNDTTELALTSEIAAGRSDVLTFGYRVEKRESDIADSFDESVYLRSFFVQNLWTVADRLDLTLSLRSDDHSKFGSETSWRATASWLALPDTGTAGLRFHGSVGTGFRAPTFNELFFPGFGNPGLDPETNDGYDLGAEATLAGGRLVVDLTWFDNTFEDLIQFGIPSFVNVAEASADGLELAVRYEPSTRFLVRASYTRTDTEDLTTGLQLSRRPRDRSTLDLDFRPSERWRGLLSLLAVSDRIDFDGTPMDDYERVDLSLSYRWTERLHPYLRVENLFDEDYAEVSGFTTPGAVAVVGLRFET